MGNLLDHPLVKVDDNAFFRTLTVNDRFADDDSIEFQLQYQLNKSNGRRSFVIRDLKHDTITRYFVDPDDESIYVEKIADGECFKAYTIS